MNSTGSIALSVTAEAMDAYCRRLGAQSRNAGELLTELLALQTFVSAHVDAAFQSRPPYNAVQAVIAQHAEIARGRLLRDCATELAEALEAQTTVAIGHLYNRLSRHGFEEAAHWALSRMETEALRTAAAWVGQWYRDAQRRAQAASGYPDALNFAGAGIQPGEYLAMEDIRRYLDVAVLQRG